MPYWPRFPRLSPRSGAPGFDFRKQSFSGLHKKKVPGPVTDQLFESRKEYLCLAVFAILINLLNILK